MFSNEYFEVLRAVIKLAWLSGLQQELFTHAPEPWTVPHWVNDLLTLLLLILHPQCSSSPTYCSSSYSSSSKNCSSPSTWIQPAQSPLYPLHHILLCSQLKLQLETLALLLTRYYISEYFAQTCFLSCLAHTPKHGGNLPLQASFLFSEKNKINLFSLMRLYKGFRRI